jgi:AraC family transcriptional regulator, regulatory protein of adaptative response / methylated-DNA-[protein]-cysteine methyltransferase
MVHRRVLSSPLGEIIVIADAAAVRLIDFHDRRDMAAAVARATAGEDVSAGETPLLRTVAAEMKAYFAGASAAFTFGVAPVGTAFQQAVWAALRTIPPGETRTYGQQAMAMGSLAAVRAVARANGQNFCSVVIPCHRVIGAGGSLTGYGGGLERKRWLIDHERRHFAKRLGLFEVA